MIPENYLTIKFQGRLPAPFVHRQNTARASVCRRRSLAVSVSLVVSAFLLRLSSISLSFSPLCVFVYLRVLILCIYRLSNKYKSICVCPSSILRECCVYLPYPISRPKAILRVARKIEKSLEMSPHESFLPLPLRPFPSPPLPSPPARPPTRLTVGARGDSVPPRRPPPAHAASTQGH